MCELLRLNFYVHSRQAGLGALSLVDHTLIKKVLTQPPTWHACYALLDMKGDHFLGFREDAGSSSTFTLEDSAICLTSEHSTMDVDLDRDDGSVLDVYLVSWYTQK